jgi:hypothetical protein
VCESVDECSHLVHSFSTSPQIVWATCDALIQKGISRKIHRVDVAPDKKVLAAPEENSNYCKLFLSGRSKT